MVLGVGSKEEVTYLWRSVEALEDGGEQLLLRGREGERHRW